MALDNSTLDKILNRGVVEIIVEEEFVDLDLLTHKWTGFCIWSSCWGLGVSKMDSLFMQTGKGFPYYR